MKYLFDHLKAYIKSDFNLRLYIATLIWVAFLLAFNFYYDFEDSYIDSFYGSNLRIVLMFLIQSISYYVVCWFVFLFTDNKKFFKNPKFWIVSAIGFAILAWNRGNSYSDSIVQLFTTNDSTHLFILKSIYRLLPIFTIILPLGLFYGFYQRKDVNHFYGLTSKNVNLKPYLVMLLIMAPIIAAASFHPSFTQQYPNFRTAGIDQFCSHYNLNQGVVTLLYEISYALSFFTVELFFRGFLIFGLVRFLGSAVVLPMAVTYCVLHFGKPFGEAVSSLFGGYILGVIALKTENIYGGVIVHIGIAWLMELFAYLQL
ncbi:MAG TPA: CPBP family intramembrane metalloprotease [Fulvivirga sp.]|nr:CPBP family intramembrane metalloprotease [Fulvivirga sp.]